MSRISRRTKFSAADVRVLSLAGLLLPITAVGLKVLGYSRWQRILKFASAPSSFASSAPELQRSRRLARFVNGIARRLPYQATCLHRSMVLWWLLRREGVQSVVELGVRKEDGRFEAHAWVKCGDVVINDQNDVDVRFRTFGTSATPAIAALA